MSIFRDLLMTSGAPITFYTITANSSIVKIPSSARAGASVKLKSIDTTKKVESFDVNNVTIQGNKFIMPAENVIITNIVLHEKLYTELEYLESTGTQYIDTGYLYTTDNVKIQIKFMKKTNNGAIFGGYDYSGGYYQTMFTEYYLKYFISNYNGNIPHNINTGIIYDTVAETHGNSTRTGTFSIIENGIEVANGNQAGEIPKSTSMALFGQKSGSSVGYSSSAKIYYCKIWDDGVLVRDFIPVLDNNNVPCLYDKVSQTFFYNAGTGDFLYGTLD